MNEMDEISFQDSAEAVGASGYVQYIPYAAVPLAPDDLRRHRELLNTLITELQQAEGLHAMYLLHPLRIQPELWREQNRKFAICWEWEVGQSVRLTETSVEPENPQAQKFFGTLAKIFPDELGHLPQSTVSSRNKNAEISHLLRRNEDFDKMFPRRRWFSPLEVFLGSGGCGVFLVRDPEAFHKMGKAVTILKADPGLGSLEYAVPRFSLQDFCNASREELETWMQLFELYITEEPDEPGILLASRRDLSSSIERIRTSLSQGA
jgi:hypothetical protein